MATELPRVSAAESVRFTGQVVLPNVIQGLFRRRSKAVAAATKTNLDKHAIGFMAGLRRKYGPGPVWAKVIKDDVLVLLSPDDVRRVLEGAPRPFAADPDAKKRGMGHFQPEALTISRGSAWEARRRFAEAVLDSDKPLHRLASRFRAVAGEETEAMLGEVGEGPLDVDGITRAIRRITRRVILGDAARDDERVSDLLGTLMGEANALPKKPSEHYDEFIGLVGKYVGAAEPGSLASLFPEAPAPADTRIEGQAVHWLFALGDTLPINVLRALALIATHPAQSARVDEELAAAGDGLSSAEGIAGLGYLQACLEEAMRLWPTTPLLSRETVEDTEWDGVTVPTGTQVMIYNTFFHRDPTAHEYADRFAPEAWTDGDAGQDWSFNHFSHGPQGCPGAGLALFVGKAVMADLRTQRRIEPVSPKLDPEQPLPHMLDYFGVRIGVKPL
jgi:cytochrome P450